MLLESDHLPANAVLMVRPRHFGFNLETAGDNEFQNRSNLSPLQVQNAALTQFDQAVCVLKSNKIKVIVLQNPPESQITPDEIFPNNWFLTDREGQITTFPMLAQNRNLEKRALPVLLKLLKNDGYKIKALNNIEARGPNLALEGTGSLVIDHRFNRVFMSLSKRSDAMLAKQFVNTKYLLIPFNAHSSSSRPIYHTNVLLSLGQNWAVICPEALDPKIRQSVLEQISYKRELIPISFTQMQNHFCANILELKNQDQKNILVLSKKAYDGFFPEQIKQLQKHCDLLSLDLSTIEEVGGGSARCMMAEIFLPQS